MADINGVYKLVKYRANKNGYNSYISPADFNLLFPQAELRYFNNLYLQYSKTQRISDSLSKFITDPTSITIDSAGKYTIPSDLLHVDSLTHTVSGIQYPIKKVEKDRVGSYLSSAIEAPTAEFPIYTQYKTFLQFYPINLGNATLSYLKKPTTSVWGYTLVSDRPVYSSGTSVQPDWSANDIDAIIYLMLTDMGINMGDQQLENFALTQSKMAT